MTRLAILLALVLGGCTAAAAPAPVERDRPTIVSLNPCTDAVLAEVAGPGQLLAISHYSQDARSTSMDPATARRLPATGGTVEEVLALKPNVVVAGSFLPPATRSAFTRLGIRVETFGIVGDVAASEAQVRALATLAGHPERGEELVARIEAALAANAWRGPPVSAILWQPDGIVPGRDQLVSELMARTGFASQSAARGMGQADYLSLESLLADPPRVLLVAGQERMQHHPALRAVPQMQRAEFAPNLLYCGGPTIIRAAQRLGEVRRGVAR
ncbi:MAG: ABC transporter substrate-binding protein [Sphingomonadales bacterium]|nr:ABC transporter substrate-binding protein [Sphingomonadales bacterium]MBD3774864.1 ABC transporter substrate-binding protein [Paracoccaceae bacterium]